MEWYYVKAGERAGPVSEEELDRLVQAGLTDANPLVWRNGMSDWQPYREAKPAGAGIAATVVSTANDMGCSECGNLFPADNMVQFGAQWVCANCKAIFVQRLKEGASLPGVLEYAGFGIRFVAKTLDTCIMLAFYMLLTLFIRAPLGAAGLSRRGAELSLIMVLVQLIFQVGFAAYSIFFLGKYGATPGKMAFKISVVHPDGRSISYGRATGRFFAELLSGMLCYVGYFIAAFDDEKRSLHDRICNTRVVKKA